MSQYSRYNNNEKMQLYVYSLLWTPFCLFPRQFFFKYFPFSAVDLSTQPIHYQNNLLKRFI